MPDTKTKEEVKAKEVELNDEQFQSLSTLKSDHFKARELAALYVRLANLANEKITTEVQAIAKENKLEDKKFNLDVENKKLVVIE